MSSTDAINPTPRTISQAPFDSSTPVVLGGNLPATAIRPASRPTTDWVAEAATWAANGSDVRLNCSGVTFMDSMGLRVLVGLWQNLTDADRTVTLIDPSERVSRVLDLAGVTQLFEQGTPVFEQGTPEPARDAAA